MLGLIGATIIYFSSNNMISTNESLIKGMSKVGIGALAVGAMLVIVIKLSVLGLTGIDWFWSEDLKNYAVGELQTDGGERISVGIKIVLLLIIVGVSETICGRRKVLGKLDIRCMRIMMLLFILPFGVYSEIFSRLLFFYFGVELVYLGWAFSSSEIRTRLAGAAVFISYGVAPNALNVLIGPNFSLLS